MPLIVHRDSERGHLEHAWLKTAHSFSFGHFVHAERQRYGALQVLNEDVIAPGQGFGPHFHDNMEIVTIPLTGALRHEDSLGNSSVVRAGDVQVMSAGTGILHSEVNPLATEPAHLLQIWIVPRAAGGAVRYEQMTFDQDSLLGTFRTIVAPTPSPGALSVRQDAWLSLGRFDDGRAFAVPRHAREHGIYLLVISGDAKVEGIDLCPGDALAAWDTGALGGTAVGGAFLLAIEVPMVA